MGLFEIFFDEKENNSQITPPKDSVKRSYELWLGDKADYRAAASFMLSADFVESKTNAGEIEVVYIYDPECEEKYTAFELNESRPYFFISPDIDEVFCSVEEFCKSGRIESALWVQPSKYETALFKAGFEYYGDCMLMYGYRRSDGSPGGMCLVYRKNIDKELLEKISGELEEAVRTYRETKSTEENLK